MRLGRPLLIACAAAALPGAAGCAGAASSPRLGGALGSQSAPAAAPSPRAAAHAPLRLFSPASPWNRQLAADAALDPASEAIMGAFQREVEEEIAGNQLNVATTAYSTPVYIVGPRQRTVRVLLDKPHASRSSLQAAWNAVPLPASASPATGTDKQLVVYQPSTRRLWEFWRFENSPAGPRAQWGGAIRNAARDPGYYTPRAWRGAIPQWGASGTSLSIAGGLITLEDIKRGRIDHALAMAVPRPRAVQWALPAQRTDGISPEPLSLPEGAHLRLDPKLDIAALNLPPMAREMAEAAQRYGIIIRDRSADIVFYAQDPTPTGTNPYLGAGGWFEGNCACKNLNRFPWTHLQLLNMQLRSRRTAAAR